MKRLKYLLLASLVAFAACDEETPPGPSTVTGNVDVLVTAGGAGVAGATVSLGAAGTTPQTTSATGTAAFTNVPAGTYVVTVTGLTSDVVCSSTTQPVTVAGGQTTGVTFACNIVSTSSISGTVAFSNGDPRPNATVTITRTLPAPAAAAVSVTTDANGRYSLAGLRSGTFTVSLPVTAGCTTAASTQTVNVGAGEARVVNFVCTVVPPPPPSDPATVAVESITFTGPLGQISNVPDNEVVGPVTVNVRVNEGEQRVSRIEVRIGNTVVCEQTFTTTAAPEGVLLVDFPFACPVNTARFNTTTGVPDFLNGATNVNVRVFTVAGGNTTPAATATRAITLLNVDAMFARVTAQRTAISTNTSATGAGRTWLNGNLTVSALPVMFSGAAVTNLTLSVNGFVPAGATSLDTYLGGGATAPNAACAALGFATPCVQRTFTAAPFSTTLSGTDDINDSGTPTSNNNGVNLVEGPITITVASVAGGVPGPALAATTICTDGQLANPILFPFTTGCANGQPPFAMLLDNWAPVIDQIDRTLRWAAQYAFPSRTVGAGCAALVDPLAGPSPTDKTTNCNGVTGWINPTHAFTATRLLAGSTPTVTNATAPRVADLGVGLPTTEYAIFRATTTPTSGTTGATAATIVNTAADVAVATVDDRQFYFNILARDVFGVATASQNTRIRWSNNTAAGTGTSAANITTLTTGSVVISGTTYQVADISRFGVNNMAPCFTADLTNCADVLVGELRNSGDVILAAGTPTVAPAGSVGGVGDGGSIISQPLSAANSAGGAAGFPQFPVHTRIQRAAEPSLALALAARCYVGVISGTSCFTMGTQTGPAASVPLSGTSGSFDFLAALPGDGAARTTNQVNLLTGALTTIVRAAVPGVGYYTTELRPVDQSGLTGPLLTRVFVRDIVAPVVQGINFTPTVTPAGSVTFSTTGTDDNELAFADLYLVNAGNADAYRMGTTQIGEFGPAAFTTSASITTTPISFVSGMQEGTAGVLSATSASLLRVFDFGRNVAHSVGGVPAVSPAPAAAPAIGTAALFSSAAAVCWDTDSNGCPTNPAAVSLTFQVTGAALVSNPFTRVEFFVGRDANNDGVVDTDGAGNNLWNSLGSTTSLTVVGTAYTFGRTVTGAELAAAAGRTFIVPAPDGTELVFIRAVGYRPNGTAFTVADGAAACPVAPGADAACSLSLQRN